MDGQDPNADDIDKNESFLKAFLEHLERHRVLLFEGASGSGKSTLVEEIAMLYISGERDGRFAEATNPDVAREEQATIVGARWTRTRDGRANMYLAVANIDGNMKYRVEMEFSSGGGTRRKCMGIDDSNGGDSEYGTNIAVWDIGFEIPLFVQNGDGRVEISIILEQAVRDQTNSNGLNWTNCASLEGVEETNPSDSGYCIMTNGNNTMTEQRLFSYRHDGREYWGPLAKMGHDATNNPQNRYVFILHEYNRVPDFLSIFGNFFENELRDCGPDAWERGGRNSQHRAGAQVAAAILGSTSNPGSCLGLPQNVKIILTGNPADHEDFMGDAMNVLRDPALSRNRLAGARVKIPDGCGLDDTEKFPASHIERNMLIHVGRTHIWGPVVKEELTHYLQEEGFGDVQPGKRVALAWQYLKSRPQRQNGNAEDIAPRDPVAANDEANPRIDPLEEARDRRRRAGQILRVNNSNVLALFRAFAESPDQRERNWSRGLINLDTSENQKLSDEGVSGVRLAKAHRQYLRVIVHGETWCAGGVELLFPIRSTSHTRRNNYPDWHVAPVYFGDLWEQYLRSMFPQDEAPPPGPGAGTPPGPGAGTPPGPGAGPPPGPGAGTPPGPGAGTPPGPGAGPPPSPVVDLTTGRSELPEAKRAKHD